MKVSAFKCNSIYESDHYGYMDVTVINKNQNGKKNFFVSHKIFLPAC